MYEPPRRRSRWLGPAITGLILWNLVLLGGVVALFATQGPSGEAISWDEDVVRDGVATVAMIEVTGEILPGRSEGGLFGRGALGADDYVSQLRQAREDDSVKAVIVRLDTPGGAVVASDSIFRAVRQLATRKPVVALMEDVAASGGYYIAAGTRHIVANAASITGSIGVIAFFPNLEGTADKLGVRPIVIKSGRLKDIGSPFRDMTADERGILQRAVDQAYDQFVDAVAAGRRMPEARVRRLADGRIYTGRQAKDAGLVDTIGGIDEAIAEARREASISTAARVVRYVRRSAGLGDLLLGARGGIGGRTLRDAIVGAGAEVAGIPKRPGLSYLWLG